MAEICVPTAEKSKLAQKNPKSLWARTCQGVTFAFTESTAMDSLETRCRSASALLMSPGEVLKEIPPGGQPRRTRAYTMPCRIHSFGRRAEYSTRTARSQPENPVP